MDNIKVELKNKKKHLVKWDYGEIIGFSSDSHNRPYFVILTEKGEFEYVPIDTIRKKRGIIKRLLKK